MFRRTAIQGGDFPKGLNCSGKEGNESFIEDWERMDQEGEDWFEERRLKQ